MFGDYDVDGACSAALTIALLRGLGCTVLHHVPHRMTEGYGPNAPALLGLTERGASLIVCVDCGTAAGEVLAVLRGRTEVIVLDHHKADGPPPSVVATVNPNRLDDRSGLSMLCAAAVAFMTGVATVRSLRRRGFFAARPEPDLLGLLDLVALATVCDVMPLTGLNRALVCQGLKIMARRARPGLAALMVVAQTRDRPSAATCGFGLGPRINAGGRISEADLGLRLLLTEDATEAAALAERLDGLNRQRQEVEAAIQEAAFAAAEAQAGAGRAALVVAGEAWHPGVVGIVAGRIKERFNRPACVAGVADGVAKGSGRSVPGHRSRGGGDRGAAGRHSGDRRRASDGGRVLDAGRSGGGLPRFPGRAAGRRGGAAGRRRPGDRGHAGGTRRDHRAGEPSGPAGTVRGGQSGAGVRGAARPGGTGGSGGTGAHDDPRVRGGRRRWWPVEGDAVPGARWRTGSGDAEYRRAVAPGRAFACRGVERDTGRRLRGDGRCARLTLYGGSGNGRRSARSRSSRGPGHQPFTLVTRVRIPYGTPKL